MSLVETALQKLKSSKPAAAEGGMADYHGFSGKDQRSDLSTGRVPGGAVVELPSTDRINLPVAALREAGLLPPEDSEQGVTNQIRRVKRPLVAAASHADARLPGAGTGRIIVVTSAMSGEGKSFTSLNLAMNLSMERDFNVLLVDGDVARRQLSTSMGIADRPGLTDLLAQPERDITSCVIATDVPGLFLMSAGQAVSGAPELLGSARAHAVFEEFIEQHPNYFIVFDSAPVLMAPESRALLAVGGQILFVVKAADTRRQVVTDALSAIGSGRSISLLLNQVDAPAEAQYGYNY